MAKGFQINGVDFDDLFHAPVSGLETVTFTGLSPACTYCKRVSGDNPNAAGYWKYNGTAYDAQPKNIEPETWYKVGGTIFYINTSSTNTYKFKNASGTVVSAPTVGTDCTNWTYTKTGSSVDKFYVYNPSAMFKKDRSGIQSNPYVAWTYLDTTNQSYIDSRSYTSGLPSGRTEWSYYGYYGRVFETLDGTYTGTAIGTGKTNTSNMMSLRNGVYVQGSQVKWRSQSEYSETIWYICDQFNKGTYSLKSNNTGCDDWYIPSKDELETMKNAIGASTFASMLYSGTISSVSILPWSSSAYSDIRYSWYWSWAQSDGGMRTTNRRAGNNSYCLALSRSF